MDKKLSSQVDKYMYMGEYFMEAVMYYRGRYSIDGVNIERLEYSHYHDRTYT